MSEEGLNLHACCVVLGEAGVLIRGPSGAGKSSLARRLVSARRLAGGFAAFVADDRAIVTCLHGRLVARPHPALAGLCEQRGLGIRPTAYEASAVLRLAVDLAAEHPPRMPAQSDLVTVILGTSLMRVEAAAAEAPRLVESILSWQ